MKRADFESMGDRQKAFESREANRRLMQGLPVLVRLDGRSFHTFTNGLARPYDERLSRAMVETAKFLVEETHASIGYTQSDEISLAFPGLTTSQSIIFDGRQQKMCSVFASLASVKFNQLILELIPEKAKLLPVFDARVWSVPNLDLAAEHFLWREADATRNSLTMAAHSMYSHKKLHGVSAAKKHDMLKDKGVNWNDYPTFFKRGTYVRREQVSRHLTEQELKGIPEKYRPQGPVTRSVVLELEMPPLASILNVKEALFKGAQPEQKCAEVEPPALPSLAC